MIQRLLRVTTATALGTLALSGCASTADDSPAEPATSVAADAATPTTTERPTSTPSPTKAETTTSAPTDPMTRPLTITCRPEERGDFKSHFRSIDEAWDAKAESRDSCDVEDIPESKLMEVEREATVVAGYRSGSVSTLYSMCAEPFLGDPDGHKPYSEGQRDEVEGALVLCPEHPDAEEIRSRMAAGEAEDNLQAEGRLFYDGTYRIGKDVQPGSYVHESEDSPVENCYWELLDAQGEIIDNNFISSAFRVEIRVPSSAYSLSTDGCGKFVPVE